MEWIVGAVILYFLIKLDHLLLEELLETGFGARFFDIDETKSWIRTL
jgi:hypothetical protein